MQSGSARVFGYMVYTVRVFLNQVYSIRICQLKNVLSTVFGISLVLLVTNLEYTAYNASINFGYVERNLGYFYEFLGGYTGIPQPLPPG